MQKSLEKGQFYRDHIQICSYLHPVIPPPWCPALSIPPSMSVSGCAHLVHLEPFFPNKNWKV